MNANLLTCAEKAANKRGRVRRHSHWEARRRRENLLRELVLTAGSAAGAVGEIISPLENLALLTGDLRRARPIAARITRTFRGTHPQAQVASPPADSSTATRPSRVLRERSRGRIFPQLLNGAPPHQSGISVREALAAVALLDCRKVSPHAALDFFVGSAGLPWMMSAELLHRCRLIPAAFLPAEVEALRRVREFWDRYRDGRAAYKAGVAAGEVVPALGDWAAFEPAQLSALLPGVCLPRALRRGRYLTNLVRDSSGICLDVHAAPSALPLVRHPC
jgi:hypothetical protein